MVDMLFPAPTFNSFIGMMQYMNTITNNSFWTMIVIAIFVIIFMVLSVFRIEESVLPALYITSVLSILLRVGDLVGNTVVGVAVTLTALVTLYKYFQKRRF